MASRFAAPAVLPVVTVLPPVQPSALVTYQGAPWFCDGTTWAPLGAPRTGSLNVNLGAVPTPEFTTTVAVAGLAATAKVLTWLGGTAPGKDDDEPAMDVVDVWGYVPAAGQLTVRLTGQSGFLADQFTVHYLVL